MENKLNSTKTVILIFVFAECLWHKKKIIIVHSLGLMILLIKESWNLLADILDYNLSIRILPEKRLHMKLL